jgi:hypothetical protein
LCRALIHAHGMVTSLDGELPRCRVWACDNRAEYHVAAVESDSWERDTPVTTMSCLTHVGESIERFLRWGFETRINRLTLGS